MAVVLPNKKLIVIPKPNNEKFSVLDQAFITKELVLPNKDKLLILPHGEDSLKVLENLEINVDGCGMFDVYYEPPKNIKYPEFAPFWYQYETAKFLAKHPRAFCTSTPRTGKTLATLMAVDFIQQQVGGSALIVAPLTVADGGEWERTLQEWFPSKKVVMVHKNREAQLQEYADVYLVNPDGLKICEHRLTEMAARGEITIAVFDELTEFANEKSQRTQAAMRIVNSIDYRWGLTGTPGKPDKIYGQVKLINPNNVPKYFIRWRDMTMYPVTSFKWKPKEGHEKLVKDAMTPCIRFDKDDVLNVPKPQVITEYVDLSPQQKKITQQLLEEMRVAVSGEEIDATTASTLAQKLLQVSGGAVKAGNEIVRIDATPKLEKLNEILNRTPNKKVIFGSFIAINDMLVEYVREQGFTCEKIDGSVTGERRKKILSDFMKDPNPHVLVCHPRTTAFGVELASADMIICYGTPLAGAFMYQQLFERLSSTKQKAAETFVVHLAAGRQDKVSFASLASGVSVEQKIVNIFTQELL